MFSTYEVYCHLVEGGVDVASAVVRALTEHAPVSMAAQELAKEDNDHALHELRREWMARPALSVCGCNEQVFVSFVDTLQKCAVGVVPFAQDIYFELIKRRFIGCATLWQQAYDLVPNPLSGARQLIDAAGPNYEDVMQLARVLGWTRLVDESRLFEEVTQISRQKADIDRSL
jgi:hypothetical protein